MSHPRVSSVLRTEFSRPELISFSRATSAQRISVRLPQGGSVCCLAVGVLICWSRRRCLLLRPVLFVCRVGFPGRRLRAHLLHCYEPASFPEVFYRVFCSLSRCWTCSINQWAATREQLRAVGEIAVGPRNPAHHLLPQRRRSFALAVGAHRAALLRSCCLLPARRFAIADIPPHRP